MDVVKWFFSEKHLMVFYPVIALARFSASSAPLSPMASGVVQKGRIKLPFAVSWAYSEKPAKIPWMASQLPSIGPAQVTSRAVGLPLIRES